MQEHPRAVAQASQAAGLAQRIPFLDIVRAVAIVSVVLHHYHLSGQQNSFVKAYPMASRLFDGCYIGVDAFFVLSGWLIGGQLLRKLKTSSHGLTFQMARTFLVRRWLRTLPAYYAVLLGLCMLTPPRHLFALLTFTQNYVDPDAWHISWSLCIEEHFYLVLPFMVMLASWLARRFAWIPIIMLGLAMATPSLWRWLSVYDLEAPEYEQLAVLHAMYFPTHVHSDGLAIGVALACAYEWRTRVWNLMQKHARVLAIAGVGLLLLHFRPVLVPGADLSSYRWTNHYMVFDLLLVGLGVGCTFPWGLTYVRNQIPGVAWLSDHAYAIYLTHMSLFYYLQRLNWLREWCWLRLLVDLAIVCVVAFALRVVIEVPFLRLRDRVLAKLE